MKSESAAFALVVLALLSGCVTSQGLRPGDRVAVEAEPDRYGSRYPVEITISNRNIGMGAGVGGGTGAAAGALAGLGCGPLVVVCAPLLGLVGFGAGSLAGAAVGSTMGLSAETEAMVHEKTRVHGTGERLRPQLVAAIREKLGERWTVVDGDAPTRILLSLDRVTLDVDSGQNLMLGMVTTVTIRRADRDPRARAEILRLSYRGEAHPPRTWAEDRDGFIGESLRAASRHIANMVYAELSR